MHFVLIKSKNGHDYPIALSVITMRKTAKVQYTRQYTMQFLEKIGTSICKKKNKYSFISFKNKFL